MTGDLLLSACTLESNSWTAFNASDADCLSSLVTHSSIDNHSHHLLPNNHHLHSLSTVTLLTDDPNDFASTYAPRPDTPTSGSSDSARDAIALNCIDFAGLDEFLNTNSDSNDLIYAQLDSCSSTVDSNGAVDLASEFLQFTANESQPNHKVTLETQSASTDSSHSTLERESTAIQLTIPDHSESVDETYCDVTSSYSESISFRSDHDSYHDQPSVSLDAAEPDTTSSQFRFECPFCRKCFHRKYLYERHVQSHTGEKPFRCSVCDRSFSQKGNLKQHMSVHKAWYVCLFVEYFDRCPIIHALI
jgi:hypothetical protein